MTGDADDPLRAQGLARVLVRGVPLADVDPVALRLQGQVGAVVEDERNVPGLGHRAEHMGGVADFIVVGTLEAELDRGHVA